MSKKRVIIIGSGFSGLSSAVVLLKNNYDVIVLEQGRQIGGCLQCFSRSGVKYETGMHFIGSARPDQTIGAVFKYLEIYDNLSLSQLDETCYNIISIEGKEYPMANGREAFIDGLAHFFPDQRKNLETYFDLVDQVASASTLHTLKHAEADNVINNTFLTTSINHVIDSVVTDPLLANILVGDLPLYSAQRDKTPFATHAFIRDFYNQSAFRIVGGSDIIAKSLTSTINRYGGQVLKGKKVTSIKCDDTHALGVEVNNTEFVPCDYVVSDIHPIRTLELLDTRLIRPAYRNRVNNMPQTEGCFTLYVHFKKDRMPYMNHNYFAYDGKPWGCEDYNEQSWPKGWLYMHFCNEDKQKFAESGEVISYMNIKDVLPWQGTSVGRRGQQYEAFKLNKAHKLMQSVERVFPGFSDTVADFHTSTPLTYLDYTGTADGSMYGIAKDVNAGAGSRISYRTKVPNLFLTGQNVNSHGLLGTMVGAIVTCSAFVPSNEIYNQIIKCRKK